MSLTLVLGGQKSGKSSVAARFAEAHGGPVCVIAPAEPTDGDFAARIARHRADRPGDWDTRETFDVAGALRGGDLADRVVVVDALDTWLLAAMRREGLEPADDDLGAPPPQAWQRVLDAADDLAAAATARTLPTIVIAGLPGMGPIGATPLVRWYADLHGLACRRLADAADRTLLTIAGRALDLDAMDVAPPRS